MFTHRKRAQKVFVYFQHNAIVKIDVRFWRYNFEGHGFSDTAENAFACACRLSTTGCA